MVIHDINSGDEVKPTQGDLAKAITEAIEDIATDKLTHIEILGTLDFVSKCYYRDNFGE
tara:strand:- start:333 stop:509 length:177 start_codon:yes stop_codon:yes gene_type:complete